MAFNTDTFATDGSDKTYELHNKEDSTEILCSHKKACNNFSFKPDTLNIPYIHAISKLHKNPFKFRFITAVSNCSIKPTSLEMKRI